MQKHFGKRIKQLVMSGSYLERTITDLTETQNIFIFILDITPSTIQFYVIPYYIFSAKLPSNVRKLKI